MKKNERKNLYILMKNRTLSLEDIKLIINEKEIDNIIICLISTLRLFKSNDENYISNLKMTIMNIVDRYDIDINLILNEIKKEKSILYVNKLPYRDIKISLLKELYNIVEVKKKSVSEQEQFDFLKNLIFEVRQINYLKHILYSTPHYINSKDKEGRHIMIYLIKELIKSDSPNYIDAVINEFILNGRFNLSRKDLIDCTKLLKQEISKKDKKLNYYKSILDILLNKEITLQNIDIIDKKYDINRGFNILVKDEIKEDKDYIITIDSEKTLDMDDALSIKKENGIYKLKIYITDVASFIKEGSNLDLEAYRRCETLYLSDDTIHMLPTELSTGLLSLNSSSYKKSIVLNCDIYETGEIGEYSITQDAILVDKKTSYSDVNNILKKGNDDTLGKTLIYLSEIAYSLRKRNPDKTLYRIIEDIQKQDIYNKKNKYEERTTGEIIVEESMILYNYLLAKTFNHLDYPYIYRNHLAPENSTEYKKLLELRSIVDKNYFEKDKYIKLLDMFSKMLNKAYYSLNNEGHFGLDLDSYSHGSSPIRRYPDILVQRLIHEFILSNPNLRKDVYWSKKIEEICNYSNMRMEQNLAYEREYERIKTFTKL